MLLVSDGGEYCAVSCFREKILQGWLTLEVPNTAKAGFANTVDAAEMAHNKRSYRKVLKFSDAKNLC